MNDLEDSDPINSLTERQATCARVYGRHDWRVLVHTEVTMLGITHAVIVCERCGYKQGQT